MTTSKRSHSRGSLRLDDYLPYRLSVAANAVSRLIASAYEHRFHLSIAQWRLLASLADARIPLTQQTLCGRTVMDKVMVMRAAKGLLRRRLVRRLPHRHDKRSHHLALTQTGQRIFSAVEPLALEYEKQLLQPFRSQEIRALERMLRTLQAVATALIASQNSTR